MYTEIVHDNTDGYWCDDNDDDDDNGGGFHSIVYGSVVFL